jgi:MFS family permease
MATTTASPRLLGLRLPDSLAVLGERDFRVVWTGQAISMSGTWMQVIAQSLLVLELWDSAFALGAVNFANALPSLIIMLFGGVLADRADKRKILLATQIGMAAIALCVGLLVRPTWCSSSSSRRCWSALRSIHMPAYLAFLPGWSRPGDQPGRVMNSATFHGSRMVGPAVRAPSSGVRHRDGVPAEARASWR